MQFLIDQGAVEEMQQQDLPNDCYAYEKNYAHHYYKDGEKILVVRALYAAIAHAKQRNDEIALAHLQLHEEEVRSWAAEMERKKQSGSLGYAMQALEAVREQEEAERARPPAFVPPLPVTIGDLGLNDGFISEMIIRTLYFRGNLSGGQVATELRVPFYGIISILLEQLRHQELIDIAGQIGLGDVGYVYTLTNKGQQRALDVLTKTAYSGPMPVSFADLIASINAQTIKNVVVTRTNIRKAFADLIISDTMFSLIGPAVNSGSSVFFFGAAGNGKTSIAERITRLMGDSIFVPYAVETDGQIIKIFDPINHNSLDDPDIDRLGYDARWVRIKRPVVVVGGELTLESLDLVYNENSKVYEAPFQMKANGGIFLIDDFGRQLVRPQELLNRWIVPLEKRYDYLTLVTGKKLEVPFDQLICFSTNLDPADMADEAFLRRIKYKINIIDPTEQQFREIFKLVCKGKKVPYDDKGVDYLIKRWYKPFNRPFRSCQPRDILDQMVSLAKYNLEKPTMSPDLIDSACTTYFVNLRENKEEGRARPKFV
jgi:hypothetical protein